MKKVEIFGALMNGGDGSAYVRWYLSEEKAENAESDQPEGWGESCVFMVETYEGSNIHEEAVADEQEQEDEQEDDQEES
jgi:hypothetical protein